jgi:hypothetical protein
MFNDQQPPVVTDEEVGDFIASLHESTPAPLTTIVSEVVDGLAWASEDTTDGTESTS